MKNIIGMRFGKLVVERFYERRKYKNYYHCKCDCGNTVIVEEYNLIYGNSKSCGCSRYDNKYEDLVGHRFGMLVVIEIYSHKANGKGKGVKWKCLCDCGNETIVDASKLKNGHTKSCGCLKKNTNKNNGNPVIKIDLTGQKFGELEVISYAYTKNHANYWLCKCSCGNIVYTTTSNLRSGRKTSCGCKTKCSYNNLEGKRFSKLTVLYRNGYYVRPSGERLVKWHCICDCGNECDVIGSNLINGDTKSCGCLLSKGESKIEMILNNNEVIYEKQYVFKDTDISSLRFDFAIFDSDHNIVGCIEYDGIQHFEPTKFHHCTDEEAQNEYKNLLERDKRKNDFCTSHSIPLYRISYKEIDCIETNVNELLNDIFCKKNSLI